ncbi:MAG: magnesium chelatase family protein, partial [Parcubacteria group bacterium Gr01-1014_70]
QAVRFNKKRITANSEMSPRDIETYCKLSDSVHAVLMTAAKTFNLSARAYHRVIKIARTIADLEGSEQIGENHILEAVQYRPKVKS